MNRFTAFSAAIVLAIPLSSVAAKADYHYGPVQSGNQCFVRASSNGRTNDGFGYWAECPKPASTAATPRRSRSSSKQQ
jgi:hypothetical protein